MNKRVRIVVLIEEYKLNEGLVNRINSNKNYQVVASFENAIECLNYLLNHESDILIFDLMLTNIDGAGIINYLKKRNPKAFKQLLCISDFNSSVFGMLEDLSVDYCLRKPFNLDYFMEVLGRTLKNAKEVNNSNCDKIMKSKIQSIFIQLGVPRHLKGYKYLVTGITNVCKDINLLNEITKELYPGIAREYATTASRVEQAIRHVIKLTWANGNQEDLENIFGFRAKRRPCNSEFISVIVDFLLSDAE